MSQRWVISFPCWGDEKRGQAKAPLLSLFVALRMARIENALLIVNTDWPPSFREIMKDAPCEVRYYSVPDGAVGIENYLIFGSCHQQAIDIAKPSDRVALLCGDMTVSLEAFEAAEKRFAQGKMLIQSAASSCIGAPPIGARATELLDWSLENLTPMCRELFWNTGRGFYTFCSYFPHSQGMDFRAFHLHPFAVVKKEGLKFRGGTSDLYLLEEFEKSEIHTVTTPSELALVERSNPDRRMERRKRVNARSILRWMLNLESGLSPMHVWNFSHQITLSGRPNPMNKEIADRIIENYNYAKKLRDWAREPEPEVKKTRVALSELDEGERVWGGG